MDDEVGFFLSAYPEPILAMAGRLRALVLDVRPDAVERLRSGWALVGYDLPLGRNKKRYFAFIAPERHHIHLGFEYGAWMADPDGVLEGAHIRLKKVRFITFEPGAALDGRRLKRLIREGAEVALLSPFERVARALDIRDRRPE